jgi:hypothetical protein
MDSLQLLRLKISLQVLHKHVAVIRDVLAQQSSGATTMVLSFSGTCLTAALLLPMLSECDNVDLAFGTRSVMRFVQNSF